MNQDQIESRIRDAMPDSDVAVFDLTGGGDHWEVRVTSRAFSGQSRIRQHQSIMDLFAQELKSGEVHALSIKTIVKT
ncbi:MAG: BolA family transcriptional regulator [Bdellovibrionales bacterium]|nr:BolA family transcriptional regulator [Bdellovibrionales bacterium]